MENVLQRLARGSRVAVVRLRSLGDCVLTTPALEILHHARPDVRTAIVVEDRYAAVFTHNPAVAAILPPRAREVAGWRPRLCLNLHGGPRSLLLTLASRARFRAGFAHFRAVLSYNVRIPTAQTILGVDRKVHTAEHLASAIFHLGAPCRDIPPACVYGDPRKPDRTGRPYAVIHPFASSPAKTWRAAGFAAVARHIRRTWELDTVFVSGGEDLSAFNEWRGMSGASLEDLKSLVAGASLFAGNDSGPAHMAAALGVPSVVIFGDSDPVIWGPWKAIARTIVAEGPISSVAEAEVMAAIDELLKVPA